MKHPLIQSLGISLATLVTACHTPTTPQRANAAIECRRPVSTYSIVARDPNTGELGVAVQSHWFSVGSVVPWAQAGVGAVATQSLVDPAYGPLGLEAMRLGRSAPDALQGLLAGDEGRELRQVAMIDAQGRVAGHTGNRCIADAGHITNESAQFSVQANLMASNNVWPAMAQAYRSAKGDLAERMLAALDAAQAAGGDIRGKQSAAILIVNPQTTGKLWIDRKFDLRVEDHPEPLIELRRLVRVQRAYLHMNAGDLAVEKKDFESAGREYAAAEQLCPHIVEMPFWHAVALASGGKIEEALPIFRQVFTKEPVWADLVPRLVKSGLLPDDPKLIESVLEQSRDSHK
ncbi:MAG: DUF1028 domain-containing protein [Phycisphaerales bacterium]|nr:DUF1028 domain-containing protein [Phycisphaerales bacterium]MCI0630898.1 DUF1028 domain-containing protein [Phycisphaerales bacterium]